MGGAVSEEKGFIFSQSWIRLGFPCCDCWRRRGGLTGLCVRIHFLRLTEQPSGSTRVQLPRAQTEFEPEAPHEMPAAQGVSGRHPCPAACSKTSVCFSYWKWVLGEVWACLVWTLLEQRCSHFLFSKTCAGDRLRSIPRTNWLRYPFSDTLLDKMKGPICSFPCPFSQWHRYRPCSSSSVLAKGGAVSCFYNRN